MYKRILREPFTYFVFLGALIYMIYIPEVSEDDLTAATITLPGGFVEKQRNDFEKRYRRKPTDQELNTVLEQAVNDEILFREAWRLQLFVGDDVVRKRMIQKMRYVLEEGGSPEPIPESQIDSRLAELKKQDSHITQFSLFHVAFSDFDTAKSYLSEIEKNPASNIKSPSGVIAFPLGNVFSLITLDESERLFGKAFREELVLEKASQWQGPIKSRYGYHVVKLDDIRIETRLDDTEMRESVRQDLLRENKQQRHKKAIEDIKTRYQIAYTE